MLTKEISEVEKEIERLEKLGIYATDENINDEEYLLMQSEKLSTLKSAQVKFDKFVEDLKEGMKPIIENIENECKGTPANCYKIKKGIFTLMDELSSKQEEEC